MHSKEFEAALLEYNETRNYRNEMEDSLYDQPVFHIEKVNKNLAKAKRRISMGSRL